MERTSKNSKSLEEWVLQVDQSLSEKPPLGSILVYPLVPKSLRNKNTEAFYTPQVISFGPYHFQMKEPIFDEVEVLKSEVARRVNELLNNSLRAVVKNFLGKETQVRIQKIYAKGFPCFFSPDVLAWMMTRDACFLLEILTRFSEEEKEERKQRSSEMEKQISLPFTDHVLCRKRYHPLLNDIVKDMFKMENQLPLWVLDEIRNPLGWYENDFYMSALKNLSPVEVSRNDGNQIKYDEEQHILHLLHEYIVDKQARPSPGRLHRSHAIQKSHRQAIQKPHPPSFPVPNFRSILSVLLWVIEYVIFLFFLTPLLVIWLTWSIMEIYVSDKAEEEKSHVPTLEELRRIGVRFRKLEGRGISHINFEQSTRTLYLPKFKVDDRSEVILRNLMAIEIYSVDVEKPITRYAILMNDLVNTSEDIAILRRHNIITSKLGSDDDVARLWNSVVVATEMPMYQPIDSTAANINAYRKKRWKVLWAQFRMIHCSKPWLVVSLIGGTSLLLLSIVQVACLFRSCKIK